MANKEDKKRRGLLPTVSRVLPTGEIIELLYDAKSCRTRLAVSRNGKCTLEDTVAIDENTKLVPYSADNNLIKHQVLVLPEKPDPFVSVPALILEIDAYIYGYVDLTENFRKIAAYYVLLTWVYDAFNELPYLRFRGDFGSGKSRALMVIGSLCYKAFFASGASTVSPIFHLLDSVRGTLIVDEADFRFSDEKADLVKILNNGNVRGFPVLRTVVTPNREFNPRAFNVFSPKIVAMRHGFEDQALESRFITEEMGQRQLRDDIPINLPDKQKEEALALRNKLLSYRFEYLPKIRVNASLVDPALSPRANQILVPLLSIIEDEGLQEEIRLVAKRLERSELVARSSTAEAQVLDVLSSLLEGDDRASATVGEITAALIERYGGEYDRPITNRYVGNILRKRLHLTTYKSHGVYVVPAAVKGQVDILCKKYGVAEADSVE
jgi:hypothetical protein